MLPNPFQKKYHRTDSDRLDDLSDQLRELQQILGEFTEDIKMRTEVQNSRFDEIDRALTKLESSIEDHAVNAEGDSISEELVARARDVVVTSGKASATYVQRKLAISYEQATEIMQQLEDEGVVSEEDDQALRKVLVTRYDNGQYTIKNEEEEGEDDLLDSAVTLILQSKTITPASFQKKLDVDTARAARLIELLEKRGYFEEHNCLKFPRKVIHPPEEVSREEVIDEVI